MDDKIFKVFLPYGLETLKRDLVLDRLLPRIALTDDWRTTAPPYRRIDTTDHRGSDACDGDFVVVRKPRVG